jgi:hypothetical protein
LWRTQGEDSVPDFHSVALTSLYFAFESWHVLDGGFMVTAALVGALNLALNTQGKISELVKQSKDTSLKEQINTLYDHLLQVKLLAADLIREDELLRAATSENN